MIFYESIYNACKGLSPKDRAQAYEAVIAYGCAGVMPEDISPVANAIFLMAKPLIDAAAAKREAGNRGGRPRKDGSPARTAGKFINFEQSGTDWDAVADQIAAKEQT